MRLKTPFVFVILSLASLFLSGCAVFTKGTTQAVVIRSVPEGAVVKINGTAIGNAPVKVTLSRQDVYRVEVEKPGFAPQAALITPTSESYDRRFLRWGIDYDLGATKDLVPEELVIELKPSTGDYSGEDKYLQMVAQVTRADALLASGEIDKSSHRYLVNQIVAFYSK